MVECIYFESDFDIKFFNSILPCSNQTSLIFTKIMLTRDKINSGTLHHVI